MFHLLRHGHAVTGRPEFRNEQALAQGTIKQPEMLIRR